MMPFRQNCPDQCFTISATSSQVIEGSIFTPAPEERRPVVRRAPAPPPPTPTADILAQLTQAKAMAEAEAPAMTLFPEIDEAERSALIDHLAMTVLICCAKIGADRLGG